VHELSPKRKLALSDGQMGAPVEGLLALDSSHWEVVVTELVTAVLVSPQVFFAKNE
jgi:hypothetical protein